MKIIAYNKTNYGAYLSLKGLPPIQYILMPLTGYNFCNDESPGTTDKRTCMNGSTLFSICRQYRKGVRKQKKKRRIFD